MIQKSSTSHKCGVLKINRQPKWTENGKKMVTTFSSRKGHIGTTQLDNYHTDNAEWYITICLPEIFKKSTSKVKVLPFAAALGHSSAHSAPRTLDFFKGMSSSVTHIPYSPDMVLFNFFTFPKVKIHLCRRWFSSDDEVIATYLEASKQDRRKHVARNVFQVVSKNWKLSAESALKSCECLDLVMFQGSS